MTCKALTEKKWYDKNQQTILEYRTQLRSEPKWKQYIGTYSKQYRSKNRKKIKQQQQEWYENNPEYARKYRRTKKGRIVTILANIKDRAKRLGLEFNLTHDDIDIPLVCPVLKIPIERNSAKMGDHSPSVDRVDNTKGYVKGNVRIISMRANRLKSDASFTDLEQILAYMNTTEK